MWVQILTSPVMAYRGIDGRLIDWELETTGTHVLDIVAKGKPEPVWRQSLTEFSAKSFSNTDINAQTVRSSTLEAMGRQLHTIGIPYFIAGESENLVSLLVVVE
jgi:hypothetical protein